MAAARYIEAKAAESWRDLSALFGNWLTSHHNPHPFGWVEGDSVTLADGVTLFCFEIADHHGPKIDWFEQWAIQTGRLYGVGRDGAIHFPGKPGLVHSLPAKETISSPPWMK